MLSDLEQIFHDLLYKRYGDASFLFQRRYINFFYHGDYVGKLSGDESDEVIYDLIADGDGEIRELFKDEHFHQFIIWHEDVDFVDRMQSGFEIRELKFRQCIKGDQEIFVVFMEQVEIVEYVFFAPIGI